MSGGRSVATIIVETGRVLIGRRGMDGDCAGLWEFPGGKVEAGESDEEALVREFDEEFGLPIEPMALIGETGFEHRGTHRTLAAWACRRLHFGVLELRAHLEVRWCRPEEMSGLPFVESDSRLLPRVIEWVRSGGEAMAPSPRKS